MGTVTNPLGGLLRGMLQGYQLANQIKQQAMQEEAHQRNIAAADHESQVRDIQTRMMLDQNARPVNAGTVADQMPSAPLPRPGGDMGEIAANLFPEMQGGEAQIPIVRPVDKARRVSYKGRDGQSQDYELLTPDEQMRRQIERAMASPQMLTAQFNQRAQDTRVGATNASRERIAETTNATRERVATTSQAATNQRATDAVKSREKIAGESRAAADKRAADAAKSREKIAAGRRDTSKPTAGQEGVQNRFQQRQLESDQKTLRDLEQKEAALHAKKIEEGQSAPANSSDGEAFAKQRNGKLSALDLQIKTVQEAKKKLIDKWQGQAQPQQAKQLTDPAVAKGYLDKAGGDKERARKLAAADGWTF
jgi:hypothetical protein